MYDTILVPTDGSAHAERAARHALALAAAVDADVHALSVVDLGAAAGPFDAGGVSDSFRDRVESEATKAVGAVADLAGPDVNVETATVEGDADDAILSYVEDAAVNLVVMGTHGRRGLRRFVAGSVTESVLRQSPVPVVTVRDAETTTDYEDLLVPTDGSDCATVAVDHALSVAGAVDATVHALSVVDLGIIAAQSDVTPANALVEQFHERAETATESIRERASERGLDATATVVEGFPGRAILDYVEEERMDFVAMGTRGRSGLDRFMLGSTTERIVRHADPPVLTVRPPDDA